MSVQSRRGDLFAAWVSVVIMLFPALAHAGRAFTLFESGQVRPLALTPDGRTLYAVNTPANRLELFQVTQHSFNHIESLPVGLEPVALALRGEDEVWVVNHLSDSVSIVKRNGKGLSRIVRTLLVGDEPRDIVFAGPQRSRAFITTAHRGQNTGRDPQLTTPGVGRADVWVFDAQATGDTRNGQPLTVMTLFTDTPRALAASADGSMVYAAGFHTGNQTTAITEPLIRKGTRPPYTRVYPEPKTNYANVLQPSVGLIVKFNGMHWVDELNQVWDDMVPFSLADQDVFTIDALADPPVAISGGEFTGVGTILFNMVVNPVNGHVYVSNTEAMNHRRFEGAGVFSKGQTVRGHLHESHITVLGGSPRVAPRHLNKHIDYSHCCAPIPNDENATSVAFPQDMAISSDGATLYATAFGSSEIAVYDTAELEADSFTPDPTKQIHVSGGGPSGVVLDEGRKRLYILTRFDNAISVLSTKGRREVAHIAMFNPEPRSIVEGRPLLYDASHTSSHGDSACASCHVFGDLDSLAWDLGDPDLDQSPNTGPFLPNFGPEVGFFLLRGGPESPHFRPMKGPMTTQSLRGLDNHGPMHWRGDRTGGNDDNLLPNAGPSVQPNGGAFNEDVAFRKFNVAFTGLNGRHAMLDNDELRKLTRFVMQITYPPNPVRALDNTLTAEQQRGADFYLSRFTSDTFATCNGCHVLDRNGNKQYAEVLKPGFFGSDGRYVFEGETQFFKVPHLRNAYQKVGMFGMALTDLPGAGLNIPSFIPLGNNALMGPQIRGFGFLHDGSVDTIFSFLGAAVFLPRSPGSIPSLDPRTPASMTPDPGNVGLPLTPEGLRLRRDLEAFVLAFDSNMYPVVGQQVTVHANSDADADARVELLTAAANTRQCDLIAKDAKHSYLYLRNGRFALMDKARHNVRAGVLAARGKRAAGAVTYTCVPPLSGKRIASEWADGQSYYHRYPRY